MSYLLPAKNITFDGGFWSVAFRNGVQTVLLFLEKANIIVRESLIITE